MIIYSKLFFCNKYPCYDFEIKIFLILNYSILYDFFNFKFFLSPSIFIQFFKLFKYYKKNRIFSYCPINNFTLFFAIILVYVFHDTIQILSTHKNFLEFFLIYFTHFFSDSSTETLAIISTEGFTLCSF